MIPKIIHFMWLDKKNPYVRGFPDKYKDYVSRWIQMNPGWKVVMWNYEDIESEFPEYMNIIKKIPLWISKCDFARFLVVMKYGGVYMDLDVIPNRPFDNRVIDRSILLIFEPQEHTDFHGYKGLIGNCIFGAEPMHPFILGWIHQMTINIDKFYLLWNTIKITGPEAIYLYYTQNWKDKFPIYSEDTCLFIPVVSEKVKIKSSSCNIVESYCYTKWSEGTGWIIDQIKYNIISWLPLIIIFAILFVMIQKYNKNRKIK